MFKIDNKNLELTTEEIFVGDSILNKVNGYFLGIKLEFINKDTKEKGYINLDVDFNLSNDIEVFTNKEYEGINFEQEPFVFFEVYDTEKFLDSEIDTPIKVKIGSKEGNKINASFEVKHELINIYYEGKLDIVKKYN